MKSLIVEMEEDEKVVKISNKLRIGWWSCILKYFKKQEVNMNENLLGLVPKLVEEEDNEKLTGMPTGRNKRRCFL